MNVLRHKSGFAALVIGGADRLSCDTRLPTQPPSHEVRPPINRRPTLASAFDGGHQQYGGSRQGGGVVVTPRDKLLACRDLNTGRMSLGARYPQGGDRGINNRRVGTATRTIPVRSPAQGGRQRSRSAPPRATRPANSRRTRSSSRSTTPEAEVPLYCRKSGRY